MGEALQVDMAVKLVVASSCHRFLERCRDAFCGEAFPDIALIEARSVRQLLLAIAPLRQASLLIDSRLTQNSLGDLIDMLHGSGFSGPIIAAAPQAAMTSLPSCVAKRLPCDASQADLRQTLAEYLRVASPSLIMPANDDNPLSDGAQGRVKPFWQQERHIIEQAVRAYGGNVGRAARALEISPSTIYRKMQSWQAH